MYPPTKESEEVRLGSQRASKGCRRAGRCSPSAGDKARHPVSEQEAENEDVEMGERRAVWQL